MHEYSYRGLRDLWDPIFQRTLIFSMTDERVDTSFHELAWYFIGVCFKGIEMDS